MRVALYQMQATPGAVADNLARIEQAAFAASIMGAALLVTPEMSVTGYALGAETASFAEPADGPILARLKAMAAARNIAIVAGFPERSGDAIYNSAALVRPDGTVEVYRKCHLYGALERNAFRASDTPPAVFQIGGLKAAMVICYDVEFPEFVRSAALAGTELLIVPTALAASEANRMIPDRIVPARALENQMFVIYADLCGSDGVFDYEGAFRDLFAGWRPSRPRRTGRGTHYGRSRPQPLCVIHGGTALSCRAPARTLRRRCREAGLTGPVQSLVSDPALLSRGFVVKAGCDATAGEWHER